MFCRCCLFFFWFLFFFSSRRRHTRWNCDWSSDVCSSDLIFLFRDRALSFDYGRGVDLRNIRSNVLLVPEDVRPHDERRSEERRVGKECRSRWSTYHSKKKIEKTIVSIEY